MDSFLTPTDEIDVSEIFKITAEFFVASDHCKVSLQMNDGRILSRGLIQTKTGVFTGMSKGGWEDNIPEEDWLVEALVNLESSISDLAIEWMENQ